MKQFNTRILVRIAILVAVSVALYALDFPIWGPLRMDFSDLPVAVAGLMMGVVPGVIVAFLKNLIHLLFLGSTAPIIGEVANFSFAVLFMLPFALIKGKDWKHTALSIVAAIAVSTVGMFIVNYFVVMPWYGIDDPTVRLAQLFSVYTPFNLVKGMILSAVYVLIKPQIDRMN